MPIKRRLTQKPESPKPKPVKAIAKPLPPEDEPEPIVEEEPAPPPAPKTLKPLHKVKRRFGRYIYLDKNEELVVRTPSRCTSWNNSFRIHVVGDYSKPDTLIDAAIAQRRMADMAGIYKIEGRTVKFQQNYEKIGNMRSKVIVKESLVIDVQKRKALVLNSPDPALRMLAVYSFLTGEDIHGLAAYTVIDWTPQERTNNGN